LAPIDQALPGSGMVAAAGQRKAVQHPAGGTVVALSVREGDAVRQGQVLLTLDVAPQRAELDAVERQQLLLAASAQRLHALLDGASALRFNAQLIEHAGRVAGGERILAVQRDLFASQRIGRDQEQRQLAAREAQLRAELDGHQQQLKQQRKQRGIAEQQLASLEGLTPRATTRACDSWTHSARR
jgi:protease secretion system membrane fusion protein